ncbi:phosphotransferase enzyme family protein [Paenibacillus lautus]|uniref:phosphotransferase enzyme family protein n=1 Tax=Paenibacillus lautus TaxID=1401 RepID=UPI002DB96FE1|nr:phosphotransferase [Paenibacillus lautus]MEC0259611.1 phosphotransferase [Paenibacillus lautus]
MMKLTTMVRGVRGDAVARELIRNWEFDEGTLKFWRASSNFVYVFERDGERHFLRFNYEEESTVEQMTAELEFMRYLIKNGYPCVTPVSSVDGNWIETVQAPEGHYHGVVFSAAAGIALDGNLTATQCKDWGKSLARLHTLSSQYEPGSVRRRSAEDILRMIDQVLQRHPEEQDAVEELHRVSLWLQFMPSSRQTYGLIHYDFQLDNIFYEAEERSFHVIDFDDAMYHWFAMDIVTALADTESEDEKRAFLRGYRSIRGLDHELEADFSKFRRFDRLYGFARVLRSLEDSYLESGPAWYDGLRAKLLRICEHDRQGFREPW